MRHSGARERGEMGKVHKRKREGGVEWGAVVAPGSPWKKLRGGGRGEK